VPSVPSGIQAIPAATIPDNPAEFVTWFKSAALPRWFANADVRNAITGPGISLTGNLSTPATIDVSTSVKQLFLQPYVLVGNPVGSGLTDYRSIAIEAGVLSLTDGGAEGSITVGVVANGIGNAQIRQSAPYSVVGNASSSEANVADISATATGQLLMYGASGLTWTEALTGSYTFTPSGSTPAIQINAKAGQFAAQVISAGSSNQAAIAYSLNGSDTGYIGVDGGQNIFGDSTNGDLCIRSGGNILLGIQQTSPALTIATSSGNVNVVGGMAGFLLNGTALQAIAPIWTGQHTFDYSGGAPVLLNPAAGYAGATVNSTGASEPSLFLFEQGGTAYAEIGSDGGQAMYSGSTNGDVVIRVIGASSNLWVVVDSTVEAVKIASTGAVTFAAGVTCSTTLTATTGATLTTGVTLGAAAADTVGFYGTTPIAQRASTSIQHTSNLSTVSGTISVSTAAVNQIISSLQEVMNTLHAYGLWSIS
jgi:hypothetical protein